jgi:hypothetical protein
MLRGFPEGDGGEQGSEYVREIRFEDEGGGEAGGLLYAGGPDLAAVPGCCSSVGQDEVLHAELYACRRRHAQLFGWRRQCET